MGDQVAMEPVRNDAGDTLCLNCRRYVPVAYDADYCVFGRHMRKKADDATAMTSGESHTGGI